MGVVNYQFTGDASQFESVLTRLSKSVDNLNVRMNRFGGGLAQGERNLRGFNRASRASLGAVSQLGFAVQDLAIILQGGGGLDRAVLAASNNIGVLGLAFGGLGIAVSTVAAIALPAAIQGYNRMNQLIAEQERSLIITTQLLDQNAQSVLNLANNQTKLNEALLSRPSLDSLREEVGLRKEVLNTLAEETGLRERILQDELKKRREALATRMGSEEVQTAQENQLFSAGLRQAAPELRKSFSDTAKTLATPVTKTFGTVASLFGEEAAAATESFIGGAAGFAGELAAGIGIQGAEFAQGVASGQTVAESRRITEEVNQARAGIIPGAIAGAQARLEQPAVELRRAGITGEQIEAAGQSVIEAQGDPAGLRRQFGQVEEGTSFAEAGIGGSTAEAVNRQTEELKGLIEAGGFPGKP